MPVCYNKLWKILIDKGMSKTDLIKSARITTNAMAKLGKKRRCAGRGSGEDLPDTALYPG